MGRKQKLPFEHWQIIELLHITQDFYSKPENEAAFQEWRRPEMRENQKGPPVLEHRRANQGDGF